MESRYFGKNKHGQDTTLYTFRNSQGMVMTVTDYGATLHSLLIPVGDELRDVVLGYDDALGYDSPSGTYFGATIGRNSNRIGGAAFTLNGKRYTLPDNDNGNSLHSGPEGYSHRLWSVKDITPNSITLSLHSPHGDQGYPGNLDVEVTYTLTEDNSVRLAYRAKADADTVINLTNHSYFNLSGHTSGDILGHKVWMDADFFTDADAASIPTGEILPVEGTPMDFRTAKTIGQDIGVDYCALNFGRGYDHNWCLNNGGKFAKVIRCEVEDLAMDVLTDLPGVQMYSGNFLYKEAGKDGAVYLHRNGICFETQHYPDSMNHPNFPSAICPAGKIWESVTEYRFIRK